MKVLNLQCEQGHGFEGWFASEQDFVLQCERSLVQCPLCGDAQVHKLLSAPRLNLSISRQDKAAEVEVREEREAPAESASTLLAESTMGAEWLELARRIIATSQDVGERFAEEARKMHYGEAEERSIRGKTTVEEARALVEEGIEVLPVVLPQSLKEPLQ